MDNFTQPHICALPTAAQLRAELAAGENAQVRQQIAELFDDATFVELATYTKRAFCDFLATEKSNELESVICGYGAIDGKLVYIFAEDAQRMGGSIDERHAKKIVDLYAMAMKNGAPVIGIFNSAGADIFGGAASLAAYGKIMKAIAAASGNILQIALVTGKCIGTAAAAASMFDLVVKVSQADFYVSSPFLTGVKDAQNGVLSYTADIGQCLGFVRSMISFLPENASVGSDIAQSADNLNRMVGELDFAGDALAMISTIADNGVCFEIGAGVAPEMVTAFTTLGGVKCGVVANSYAHDEGRISAAAAKKAAKFIDFCDMFAIPLVTLTDSAGLVVDAQNEPGYSEALAELAFAYATSSNAKVSVIVGHAIGAAFVLMGSKALGADVVYTTDSAQIGALAAENGVAFAWEQYITLQTKREELIERWKNEVASPVAAASTGEVDDIISISEMRARICSALLMLSSKARYGF